MKGLLFLMEVPVELVGLRVVVLSREVPGDCINDKYKSEARRFNSMST